MKTPNCLNRKAPTEVRALEVANRVRLAYIEEANDQYGSSIAHTYFHIASQPQRVQATAGLLRGMVRPIFKFPNIGRVICIF
jgi:hypothetical protein